MSIFERTGILLMVVVLILSGCGSTGSLDVGGGTTQTQPVAQSQPVTVTVQFPPVAKTTAGADSFAIEIRQPRTTRTLAGPFQFTRTGTQEQVVVVDAPAGQVELLVSFLSEGLQVGFFRQDLDITSPVAVTALGRDIVTPLAGADVSGPPRTTPRLATHPGGMVAVWSALDGGSREIFARRYGADGTALGSEFRVNSGAINAQRPPDIAADDQGGFVVTWSAIDMATSSEEVFARRFNGNGDPLGADFRVNDLTAGDQTLPRVDCLADQSFVVTWMTSIAGNQSVLMRRFDAQGNSIAGDELVSANARFPDVVWPRVAGRGPVVCFTDNTQSGLSLALLAFDTPGNPQGVRQYVIPHVLDADGALLSRMQAFDTTIFVGYTALDSQGDQTACVNAYNSTATGLAPVTMGGQETLVFRGAGLAQDFGPIPGPFPGGLVVTWGGETANGDRVARSRRVRFDAAKIVASRDVEFAPTGQFGFGLIVVGSSDPDHVAMQSFVVTTSAGFDLSVFGFEPVPISAATE